MKPGRLFAILILCVTVALAPGALAGEKPQSRIQPLIEQAVISYAAYGERDNHALMELSDLEPSVGEKWTHIMDLWEAPVTVNGELPDGLPEDDTLCLVALGFQLNPDGTMKEELIQRLKAVLVAAEKYPHALIVCTGGGTAADDPTATEAGRMAEWLEEHGVDPSRLIVEDHSLTTAQNAIYTFDILDEQYPQVGQLAIISSDYHIATGVLLFGAEAILRDSDTVVAGNASWHAPSGTLSTMFQAGALIELSGDVDTAFEIYYDTYDIHELPSLQQEEGIVNGYDETPGIETTADQETMTLEEYLERSNGAWFPTGKKEYTVNAMMVSKKTSFHNELEVADYTVTDDGITVILKGVFDEMWPTKLDKVMEAYTKLEKRILLKVC